MGKVKAAGYYLLHMALMTSGCHEPEICSAKRIANYILPLPMIKTQGTSPSSNLGACQQKGRNGCTGWGGTEKSACQLIHLVGGPCFRRNGLPPFALLPKQLDSLRACGFSNFHKDLQEGAPSCLTAHTPAASRWLLKAEDVQDGVAVADASYHQVCQRVDDLQSTLISE